MSRALQNLAGQRFGILTVVDRATGKKTPWNCICDCGQSCIATAQALKHGDKKSCGCLRGHTTARRIPYATIYRELAVKPWLVAI